MTKEQNNSESPLTYGQIVMSKQLIKFASN